MASLLDDPRLRSRPVRRDDDRVVAGVASGLAAWARLDPTVVRVAFVVLTAAAGWGIVAYAAGWLFMAAPADRERPRVEAHQPGERRRLAGLALIVAGILLGLRELSLGFSDEVVWPVALLGLGAVVLWRRGSEARQAASRPDRPTTRFPVGRVIAGSGLAATGIAAFLAANLSASAVRDSLLASAVIVAGLALIFGPWWLRLVRDLADERALRIRSDERAEMAAHLHDSVLQTLALIQRRGDSPAEMSRLARSQERELRRWLYGSRSAEGPPQLGAAVEAAAAEVEELHSVAIEAIVVGDCPVSIAEQGLVAAAREALVNAAKFSGDDRISLYVEVEADQIEAFVRDRGSGFDLDAVAEDRRGIADSIVGRMERVGGRAEIHTTVGHGTEIELHLPRVDG